MFTRHVLMRERGFQLDSTTFLCDFETALIPAIQGNFFNTQMQGCFFHFCQAMLRHIKQLCIKNDHMNNQEAESENADGISRSMAFTRFFVEPIMPTFQVVTGSNIYIMYILKLQSLNSNRLLPKILK
ncbi:hypothetical protein T02_8641 [Trichinella nativa]|uniref:MULE transposase domain-containing protein n=1 Tax=Trichinella nativa TaxID=6335 RepID=A0A0V1LP94_9BILA|nr:hypothetical protein T02_8641 [Trichinella nativa]